MSECHLQLMGTDHTRERRWTPPERKASTLAADRFGEQVGIPREARSALDARPIKKLRITQPARAVPLGGENIDTPEPKAVSDCSRDVDVHV